MAAVQCTIESSMHPPVEWRFFLSKTVHVNVICESITCDVKMIAALASALVNPAHSMHSTHVTA